MSQPASTMTTKVENAGDGSLFVPLPPELLRKLNICEGDKMVLEKQADGTLLLSPVPGPLIRAYRSIRAVFRNALRP
jgi:antitoxin component of MazEF toxin-antitoxin module